MKKEQAALKSEANEAAQMQKVTNERGRCSEQEERDGEGGTGRNDGKEEEEGGRPTTEVWLKSGCGERPCETKSSVAVYPVRRLKSKISGVRIHVLVQS